MRRRRATIFFLVLGISIIALAVALNVGWIILNARELALLVFGIIFFALIITGMVLNTIFLVREIRRNEQQDAFLNAVTHELKTPIASIKLYLETLKSRDVTPEKRLEFYDTMLSDSDRLLGTVEQVLLASRAKERSRKLNLQEFSLLEAVQEAAARIAGRYHLSAEALTVKSRAENTTIIADKAEIETAVSNLIDNAVKYSEGDPEIAVRIRVHPNSYEIFVRDKGIGIPETEQKQVFKRFYRIPGLTSERRKGSGLGLAIVNDIVAKHGGKVRAASKGAGKGSTFVIKLPKKCG